MNSGWSKRLGIETAVDLFYHFKTHKLFKHLIKNYVKIKQRGKTKIFVIGLNKTGTTTVENALMEFDLILGNQKFGEVITNDVLKGNKKLLRLLCQTGEAFQDLPFSAPQVFKYLDKAFPNSLFILTIRDTPKQWFNSLVNFHKKKMGNGSLPSESNLPMVNFIKDGYFLKILKKIYGEKTYNSKECIKVYNEHIKDVKNHFKKKQEQLLILNVAGKNSYQRFCQFINEKPTRTVFEWKNRT